MENKSVKNYPEFKTVVGNSDFPDVTRKHLKNIFEKELASLSKNKPLSILDVGPSDGEMSLPIIEWLQTKFVNVNYLGLEPEKEAFDKLIRKIRRKKTKNLVVQNIMLEAYLQMVRHEKELFDVILFSQVFYYFPREIWDKIISDSIRLLKKAGLIIIVVDSYKGKVWKMRNTITKGKIDTLEFGYLHFAEAIEEFLSSKDIKYTVEKFPVHIYIQDNELTLFNFARTLAFIFRTFPEKILASHKKDLQKFLKKIKVGKRYELEDLAKVITFKK